MICEVIRKCQFHAPLYMETFMGLLPLYQLLVALLPPRDGRHETLSAHTHTHTHTESKTGVEKHTDIWHGAPSNFHLDWRVRGIYTKGQNKEVAWYFSQNCNMWPLRHSLHVVVNFAEANHYSKWQMNSLIAWLFTLIRETEMIFFLVVFHKRQSNDDNEIWMILRLEWCIMLHMTAFISKCKIHLVKKNATGC